MNSKLTGEGEAEVKKIIVIFTYNQCLLSIDMKTKVVQHVPRINLQVLQVLQNIPGSQLLSDVQTFFFPRLFPLPRAL